MMNISKLNFLAIAVAVFLVSCDEEDGPKGKYEHGAFVVNEGGFGSSNASITFVSESTPEANILKSSGNFAGDVAQSITFHDDKGYLVLNGDNKIIVHDANTFDVNHTITHTDLVAPRYVEVINGKAYVSVWGPYDANFSLVDSYVLVYDLNTNSVVKKIDTDEGTENLLYNGNYLFASNYNYGASNTLAVINPADNSLVKQITLSAGPAGMVVDANNKLWVICADFAGGKLYRINPSTLAIEATVNISSGPGVDIAISPDKQNIFYTIGKSVYKMAITSSSAPANPLFTATDVKTLYAFNVDASTGDFWIGDAMNFSSTGKVYIYNSSGVAKSSMETGINPTQFVFK